MKLWFHLEIWSGLFARSAADPAGMTQMRCGQLREGEFVDSKDTDSFRRGLKGLYTIREGESWRGRKGKTVGLVALTLKRSDLNFDRLLKILSQFACQFGGFPVPS